MFTIQKIGNNPQEVRELTGGLKCSNVYKLSITRGYLEAKGESF